jgi:predicted membrane channel-forming protein YqfA (hemolysin III family)
MALSYKARKRWAFFILLVGLPLYVVLVVGLMGLYYDAFEQPPIVVEFILYIILGIAWVFPFRALFRGTAKPDPDGEE